MPIISPNSIYFMLFEINPNRLLEIFGTEKHGGTRPVTSFHPVLLSEKLCLSAFFRA